MVQKRIRKASLSQALRQGQARHLSDDTPESALQIEAADRAQPKAASAPLKPVYDPIRPFVAPMIHESLAQKLPDKLPEKLPEKQPEERPQVPLHKIIHVEHSKESSQDRPLTEPEAMNISKEADKPSRQTRFQVSEVVTIRPQTRSSPEKDKGMSQPLLTDEFPSVTPLHMPQDPMNKPTLSDIHDAPTSLSSLGRVPPAPTRLLRHNISDEELEILNAAKTRIEMRLFWIAFGIAIGSSFGAIPSLMQFNQTHILSLSGFFQNILFFAFTLLTLVLGVILVIKAQDIRRAYRDITLRSRAGGD